MVLTDKIRRPSALAVAVLLLIASVLPLLSTQKANAALLESRSVKMSSSASGAITDGQGLTYEVQFNVPSTTGIQGVVVEFCENSPIIGDACTVTTPADFADATGTAVTLIAGLTGFTVNGASDTNTVILTGATYTPTANETITFSLDSIDNPHTTNTTFYARIVTYDDSTSAAAHTPAGAGSNADVIDSGGIALSTAQQITITAKVQERLTFCVYTDANCGLGGASVVLGNDNGVLDDNDEFVDKNTKFDVSTNAAGDVAIRVKGDTLKAGSFDISAVGATPTRTVSGTEQFGFCSYQATGTGLTVEFKYDGNGDAALGTGTGDCPTGTSQTAGTGSSGGAGTGAGATDPYFAFDLTAINTVYGEQFATKAAGSVSQGVLAFIGNIAPTTEAGIYTTVLTFIATGTY